MAGFFDLNAEERRLHVDHANDAVREVMLQAIAEGKAKKPDPRSAGDYRGLKTMGHVAIIVVKHADKPASIEVSRDGGERGHLYLPAKSIVVQPESGAELLLITIPRWLATRIREEKHINLFGVAPALSDLRVWTKADLATWTALERLASHINCKISSANRRQYSGMRNAFA